MDRQVLLKLWGQTWGVSIHRELFQRASLSYEDTIVNSCWHFSGTGISARPLVNASVSSSASGEGNCWLLARWGLQPCFADSTNARWIWVGYYHLLSNKCECNNCFIKNSHKGTVFPTVVKATDIQLVFNLSRRVQLPLFGEHSIINN